MNADEAMATVSQSFILPTILQPRGTIGFPEMERGA